MSTSRSAARRSSRQRSYRRSEAHCGEPRDDQLANGLLSRGSLPDSSEPGQARAGKTSRRTQSTTSIEHSMLVQRARLHEPRRRRHLKQAERRTATTKTITGKRRRFRFFCEQMVAPYEMRPKSKGGSSIRKWRSRKRRELTKSRWRQWQRTATTRTISTLVTPIATAAATSLGVEATRASLRRERSIGRMSERASDLLKEQRRDRLFSGLRRTNPSTDN